MTCIVGIVDDGEVYIGGDSRGSTPYNYVTRKTPKVFKIGEFIFGYTSSFRMGQIIQRHFCPPEETKNMDEDDYIYNNVIEHLIKILKDKGYARIEANEVSGGTFLMGFRGRLFEISSDFQIGENIESYHAVGSGGITARSSLWTIEQLNNKMNVEDKIKLAITAASKHIHSVDDNIHIVSTKN